MCSHCFVAYTPSILLRKFLMLLFSAGPVAFRCPSELRHTVPRSEPFPFGATHAEVAFINLVNAVLAMALRVT